MENGAVIFFDGVCNLCNSSVQFVIKHDRNNYFKFSSLQGKYAETILPQFNIKGREATSILLLEAGKIYSKSSAVLKIARKLGYGWRLLYAFVIVPKFIRDWFYDLIAKNRYKWWGKTTRCLLPKPELREKFLA